MFYISKSFEVSCGFKLYLDYSSQYTQLQGDRLIIDITCGAHSINSSGMVVDFDSIQQEVIEILNHTYINDILRNINPTLENLAKWVCDQVDALCETGYCIRVSIQSGSSTAVYENDQGLAQLTKPSKPASQYITH